MFQPFVVNFITVGTYHLYIMEDFNFQLNCHHQFTDEAMKKEHQERVQFSFVDCLLVAAV